jgi:hypothetical protein
MGNATVHELRKKNDAAWERLERQLAGMEAHLERTHAAGEWTTRQVLCHLLFEPGFRPTGLLECFAAADPPLIEIIPGVATVTPERGRMTLAELTAALDGQRRQVFSYLETLGDPALDRKARIPLFEALVGTDEITLAIFVGALFDLHWHGHADQLAQIRQAVGLPEMP